MDHFEELKVKYQSVLEAIPRQGVRLTHLHLQDNRLFVQGAAPNQNALNAVWNQIKAVDPAYSDLTCDLTIDASLPQPADAAHTNPPQTYQVKPGDSLWKIAQEFYGRGNLFQAIIDANPDKLKDANSVIHPGDRLRIPAV
jgi:LysM repeat protein